MIKFRKANIDVFTWQAYDMLGIDSIVICHQLHVDPTTKPIKRKPCRASPEKIKAVEEEVNKLLKEGAIRDAEFSDQISNPVVVKKHNGKWRVCVDFTDLNRACLKDSFPLLRIDQLVDSAAGHEKKSFLDAYSDYHQIPLFGPDQENTAFITTLGLYCYRVMPFGLKNAGATYQRLVTKMFLNHIGKSMEIYVDDMLIKSKKKDDHLLNLNTTFQVL